MSRAGVYAAAFGLGVAAVLLILPPGVLTGDWAVPGGDQAQTLAGHLAFQADRWRWPLLTTDRLFWPQSVSIAMTDSNPLFSLAGKVWTHATGSAPVNLLGVFMALCWLLQPVAAVYAARGLGAGPAPSLVAGVIATCWPALLVRMGHINLCAHFLVLLALGLTFRRLADPVPSLRRWVIPALLLLGAVLTHPYLFQLCAAVLGAVAIQSAWRRPPGWWRDAAGFVGAGVVAVGLLTVLSGQIGGGDKGFTFFSMNLLSPFVPQRSGVFGPNLPVIDATGGQYEGYNWLGAGTLLLVIVTLARRAWPRPGALVLVLTGLTLLSLSSVVYAGSWKLIDLGAKPWEDMFGSFRSAGRAFWPVGYAIALGAVAAVGRMDRRVALPLLLIAAALQLMDTAPLTREARAAWVYGSGISAPPVPPGTTLFTVAPHPGCGTEDGVKQRGPVMLLDAVRHGAALGVIGLGRSPRWFSCERIVLDALELPLEPGEVRAFYGATVQARLRSGRLGGACVRVDGVVLCGRDVALAGEQLVPPTAAPGLLGGGWAEADGVAWSEGPRSTLLVPVPPEGATLFLRLVGVAFAPGGTRAVGIAVNRTERPGVALADGVETTVAIALPQAGLARVSLDAFRPVDPARRGLTAPVRRAALCLLEARVE